MEPSELFQARFVVACCWGYTLTAGGARRGAPGATTPRRLVGRMEGARSASTAFFTQNASESEYRQGRSSVMEKSWKQCFAERNWGKRSFTRWSDAGRGYLVPFARVEHGLALRQHALPLELGQRFTCSAEVSTRFYNRAFRHFILLWKKKQKKLLKLATTPSVNRLFLDSKKIESK